MKTIKYFAGLCLLFATSIAFAQTKPVQSEKIKVWGNCGMCKSHIEKAAKAAGATTAFWNKDTKILAVSYQPGQTTDMKIQEKIAAAGYDTRDLTADNKAYEALDECCKYDRKGSGKAKSKQ